MNPSRRTGRRAMQVAIGILAASAVAWALAAVALASHVTTDTPVPDSVAAGHVMTIPVTLSTTDGVPVAGTTVSYYLHASFAGVTGEASIGQAITDDTGVAALTFTPRLAGRHQIRMEFEAPGDSEVQVATTDFEATGDTQLYRSQPAISIPGLNVDLLLAVVATVWAILLAVAVRIVTIARGQDAIDEGHESAQ